MKLTIGLLLAITPIFLSPVFWKLCEAGWGIESYGVIGPRIVKKANAKQNAWLKKYAFYSFGFGVLITSFVIALMIAENRTY